MSAGNGRVNRQPAAAARATDPPPACEPVHARTATDDLEPSGHSWLSRSEHVRTFAATPYQVRQARRFLAGVLADCPAADDAILCLSELATNACLHSASRNPGGTFTVRILIRRCGQLRIEVTDNGGPWLHRARDDGRPPRLSHRRQPGRRLGQVRQRDSRPDSLGRLRLPRSGH